MTVTSLPARLSDAARELVSVIDGSPQEVVLSRIHAGCLVLMLREAAQAFVPESPAPCATAHDLQFICRATSDTPMVRWCRICGMIDVTRPDETPDARPGALLVWREMPQAPAP